MQITENFGENPNAPLIRVEQNEQGVQFVSARELHSFLGITERFSTWCNRMFEYGFVENQDYLGCKVFNTQAKQELQDYLLTLDTAKEIAMIQRSPKGREARQYFIACEKELRKVEKTAQYQLMPPEFQ